MNNLKQILVSALVAGLVAGLVSVIGVKLVGNQLADSQNLGASGQNRYPNSGIAAKFLEITDSPATSTPLTDGDLLVRGDARFNSAVWRDKNGSILTLADDGSRGTATSVIPLRSGDLCENPRIHIEFRTTTGTLRLASSSAMVADCLPSAGDKFLAPITIHNASGTGNFVLVAGVSSSIITPFTTSSVGSSGVTGEIARATSSLVASSSGHLRPEFRSASSTGGNWIDYFWTPFQ